GVVAVERRPEGWGRHERGNQQVEQVKGVHVAPENVPTKVPAGVESSVDQPRGATFAQGATLENGGDTFVAQVGHEVLSRGGTGGVGVSAWRAGRARCASARTG